MEKLKDLSIDEWLRYFFAGAITLFAWIVLSPDKNDFSLSKGILSQGVFILGFPLIIGTLIYSIHRAIIYPLFIQPIILWHVFDIGFRKIYVTITKLNIMTWEIHNDEKTVLHRIRGWASKFHFLWCTSWGLGVTLIWLYLTHPDFCWFRFPPYIGFCILFVVTFFSALIDTCRAVKHEKEILFTRYKEKMSTIIDRKD